MSLEKIPMSCCVEDGVCAGPYMPRLCVNLWEEDMHSSVAGGFVLAIQY